MKKRRDIEEVLVLRNNAGSGKDAVPGVPDLLFIMGTARTRSLPIAE